MLYFLFYILALFSMSLPFFCVVIALCVFNLWVYWSMGIVYSKKHNMYLSLHGHNLQRDKLHVSLPSSPLPPSPFPFPFPWPLRHGHGRAARACRWLLGDDPWKCCLCVCLCLCWCFWRRFSHEKTEKRPPCTTTPDLYCPMVVYNPYFRFIYFFSSARLLMCVLSLSPGLPLLYLLEKWREKK